MGDPCAQIETPSFREENLPTVTSETRGPVDGTENASETQVVKPDEAEEAPPAEETPAAAIESQEAPTTEPEAPTVEADRRRC